MRTMKIHPVLLGLLVLSAAMASAAAQDVKQDVKTETVNEIVVNVSNIENTDGRVGCTLFSKEDGFPSKSEKADRRVWT
ncbi:MAG: hypothetical protein JRI98_13265, partial [Deltaproteobacteria bacterium]|nr:hypothetical protein [Deltaproteobacteria bacterium]